MLTIIANIIHRDLDLYFHGHKISGNDIIFNIWKAVRLAKNAQVQILKVDISHRMAPLRMLYIVTLIYILNVRKFLEIYKYTISGKLLELVKNAEKRLL